MEISDKEEVLSMMREFYTSDAVLTNGSDEIFNTDIENCLNDSPFLEGFVFEQKGHILGYSMIAKSFSTEFGKQCIWFEDLYLKSEYRGQGIIPQFVSYIKELYQDSILKLEVEKENEHAVHVYEKMGFKEVAYMQMKKFLILFLIMFVFINVVPCAFATTEQSGIGAYLYKDAYNRKTFIWQYYPNSSAQSADVPVGSEIIAVNDKKTKKLTIEEVTNLINGEENTNVELLVKYKKKKHKYNVLRKPIILPKVEENDKFTVHWKQVAPIDMVILPIPENMKKYMTHRVYLKNNYWLERKAAFKNGYDACMTYAKKDQDICLMNLVNREINRTSQDEQLRVQQALVNEQRMQNYTNSINQMQINNELQYINTRLRQQNFHLQQMKKK